MRRPMCNDSQSGNSKPVVEETANVLRIFAFNSFKIIWSLPRPQFFIQLAN